MKQQDRFNHKCSSFLNNEVNNKTVCIMYKQLQQFLKHSINMYSNKQEKEKC